MPEWPLSQLQNHWAEACGSGRFRINQQSPSSNCGAPVRHCPGTVSDLSALLAMGPPRKTTTGCNSARSASRVITKDRSLPTAWHQNSGSRNWPAASTAMIISLECCSDRR